MGRIRILSDNVANKIAAGEVVERPASVLKELLENSLDAGSDDIRVDVENAGRRLIRIEDNGSGMLRDDALLAFERHATSKLSDVKDLLSISTLGFRGEALPSIASVSRLLLETRIAEEQTGTAVEFAGGKLLRCDEIARTSGTTITVRDLFFNVPARKKFLRSDSTELAHIGSLFTHYSLGHVRKRFELYHEGRELLNVTPVETHRERAFQVFGSEIVEELVEIAPARKLEVRLPQPFIPPHPRSGDAPPTEPDTAEFSLEGLISGPHVQKSSRNALFLFVNGRLVKDKVLSHAITSAYQNLMPGGTFPFVLLFLNCDAGEVDVNVHPAKTEVRFRHSAAVHDFVRDTLRDILMQSRPVSSMPVMPSSPVSPSWPQPESPRAGRQHVADLPFSEFSARMEACTMEPETNGLSTNVLRTNESNLPQTDLPEINLPAVPVSPVSTPVPVPQRPLTVLTAEPSRGLKVPDTHGALAHLLPETWERQTNLSALPDLRALGQLHDSFIIAAGRDGLWIIDQHVAHERVLFEQTLSARMTGRLEIQQLLMPLVLQLTPSQQYQYARIGDELQEYGFETEPFGQRTIAVKAAPAAIGPGDIERVLAELMDAGGEDPRPESLDEMRRAVCATIACHAAIKINTTLEPKKIDWLLRALAACQYPMTCPHGRPIALRYSMKDILKGFHRI